MKIINALALSLATMLAAASAQAQEFKFRFSADSATTNIKVQAFQKWADLVKEKSDGRIAIRVYPSAQLYNDVNVIPAVSSGTVDLGAPPSGLLTAVVPEAAVFELPSMWGISYEQYRRMLAGPFGQQLARRFEEKLGVKILGYYNMGAWVWGTTRKSTLVQAPADFSGKKIRVVGNPLVEQTFKAMGAQPVQMAWPEVPTALLQGVIDGLETTMSGLDSVKGWELVGNLTYANHKYTPYVAIMNMRSWKKLPADLQQIMLDTMEESVRWQDSELERINQAAIERFRGNGVQVKVLQPSDVRAFAASAEKAGAAFVQAGKLEQAASLARTGADAK
ncbi:TRAP transporter substrate-binding protein [Bordetella petrii]|uniref:TRAP transporter substrate-binding protein n=1 Tax=Bordetella petrii TaxID=94624 RepID=UPI001E435BDB|nr:TRAP transporter substrate-binding protein [Bordetella petrii]MCD0504069.1 TRAP transporter substrate-binding protein [Bordetella petrii]